MATLVEATPTDLEWLAAAYNFRDADRVRAFLHKHPEVIPPLLEAPAVVKRHFGASTQLVLELLHDPEADAHKQLFALTQTNLEPEAALAALDRFDQEWWLDALPRVNCHLTFSPEYV